MTHTPTRRLLALLLAVATVFSLLSMSVSAADEQTGPELKLVSTATEPLKKGDSFTVEVQFPSDIEFSNFELNFDFDLTQFKLTAVNTSYTRIVDGEEFEVNYIKNSGAVINMDPVVDEDNGEKYGGRIVEYILDPAKGINVKADKGILFTFTFEVLKCNADPQSISVYNRLFKKSLTAETFGDITPVITPAQISISHTLTAVPAKDATCTENGNTAYWICSACDKWFLDETGTTEITDKGSVVTKATGHKYQEVVDEKYLRSPATCTSPAVYYKSCSVCGAVGTETFESGEKAAHNYVQQHDTEKHWKECSACGDKIEVENHSGGTATCTAKAVCTTCGAEYGELAAHKYQEVVDEKYLKSPATCTSPAIYYKSCSVCHAMSEETFTYGTTIDHSYEMKHDAEKHWEECSVCHVKTNEAAHSGGTATCTAKAVCSVCYAEYGELAAHNYQETVDAKYLKSAATCTSPAVYYKSCSVCHAMSEETFTYGTTIDHSYELKHDAEKHWEECSICHAKTNEAIHSGGTATCTEKAVCSTCNAKYGELAAHNYQETVDARYLKSAATCTSPAIYYKSCSVCHTLSEETFTYGTTIDHSYEMKHDAEKHWQECSVCHTKANEAAHSGGTATCTAKAVCSTCGAEYGELAAHNYQETVDEKYLKSPATCTSPAIYYKSCSVCHAMSEETFTSGTTIDHSYEIKHDAEKHWEECSVCHAKTNEAVHSGGTATCIAKAVCSVCRTEYGALADHDTVHHGRIEPTCTTTGSIEYWQCSACSKKFSNEACTTEVTNVTLDKLPHSAGTAWEKDTTYHWHLCTSCGSEVMDKAVHTYGDWVVITEATETETGLRKRTCSVCGYEQTEEIGILRFTVTVRNGSGSGEYKSGETVTITADRRSGYTFEKWTVDSGNVTLSKETDSTTTFTMPAENVTVTATYRYNGGSGSGSSGSNIVIKDENGNVLGKADPDTGIVELPITPVPAASSSRQAEELEITIPKNTTVKVEIPVRNVTPGTVVVIVHADGTEEIVRTSVVTKKGVALELTGSATVKVYDNSKFFTDVPAANWASDAVAFASSRELFNGTGANTFSPNAPMTRQMLMTVLARLDGTDTSGNAYAKGMEWAIRNGVSNGSDPEGKITREQLATMLWRYAGNPSVSGRMTGFVDADQISSYAEDAMLWATKAGIIGGKGNGQLDPKGYATRAEVAAMLMRYCNTLFTK